jgi:hypothetical protein
MVSAGAPAVYSCCGINSLCCFSHCVQNCANGGANVRRSLHQHALVYIQNLYRLSLCHMPLAIAKELKFQRSVYAHHRHIMEPANMQGTLVLAELICCFGPCHYNVHNLSSDL